MYINIISIRHFGKEVVMNLLGKTEVDEDVEMLYQKTYHVNIWMKMDTCTIILMFKHRVLLKL
jgi:hypothetical protein